MFIIINHLTANMKYILFLTALINMSLVSTTGFTQDRKQRKIQQEIVHNREIAEHKDAIKQQKQLSKFQNVNSIYNYPVNNENRIEYNASFKIINTPRDLIFKRFAKFLALEQFNKTIQVQCKDDKAFITLQPYPEPIIYNDSDLGEVIFNGCFQFQYLHYKHYVLTFKGRLVAEENGYSYQFSDFQVAEFLKAPKTKSKGGAVNWGAGVSTASSTSTFSDAHIRVKPLEIFMQHPDYALTSHDVFNNLRNSMIERLRKTIQ